MITIRPYRPEQDDEALFALWQATFNRQWPLTRAIFQRTVIPRDAPHGGELFVAWEQDRAVGCVVVQIDLPAPPAPRNGNITALFVAPHRQRRGVGAALHDAALAYLRDRGVQTVQAGGGEPRLWPGIPRTMPAALAFFVAHGWEFSEISYDMTRHLGTYRTPPTIYSRLEAQHITIASATEAQAPDVLAFVDREFPSWSKDYRAVTQLGDYADCLLACDHRQYILGSLIMFTPQSHEQRLDVPWQALFGNDLGGLGVVGVAEAARNRGIGSALVARGSELSRARGVGVCLIGWTWAVDFYGRLGYTVWQSYAMSWRRLDAI